MIASIIDHVRQPLASEGLSSTPPSEIQLVVDVENEGGGGARSGALGLQLRFSFSGTGREDWLHRHCNSFELGFKLPIAKKLVELMRGRVDVERSEELTFTHSQFFFTAWFARSHLDEGSPAERRDQAAVFRGLGVRVLVIEKNPAIGKVVQSYLSSLQCESILAASYAEAWGLLRSPSIPRPSLLLVSEEVTTDHLAHQTFVVNLRSSPDTWWLPLVLVSRSGLVDERVLRQSGFLEAIPRPLSLLGLRATLERLYGLTGPTAMREPDHARLSIAPSESLAAATSASTQGAAAAAGASAGSGGAAAPVVPNRVLLVDDNVVNQKILAPIIRQLGLEYDVASDGRMAVDLWSQEPRRYGVVLMDTMMPVMDGFEATREIRRRERLLPGSPHVAIIAVTGIGVGERAMQNAEEQCLRAGMDEYVPKPVIMRDLKATILKWLQRAQLSSPALQASPAASSSLSAELAAVSGSGAMGRRRVSGVRPLTELCITFVADNLERCRDVKGLADSLLQRIVDALAQRQRPFTDHTLRLLNDGMITRLTLRHPFPAFRVDAFVAQLAQQQRQLEELDLSGCAFLTDRGVSFLAQMRCLRVLNLSRCPRITDWGVQDLRGLPLLRSLNLEGCDLITEAAVRMLRDALPHLREGGLVWSPSE